MLDKEYYEVTGDSINVIWNTGNNIIEFNFHVKNIVYKNDVPYVQMCSLILNDILFCNKDEFMEKIYDVLENVSEDTPYELKFRKIFIGNEFTIIDLDVGIK